MAGKPGRLDCLPDVIADRAEKLYDVASGEVVSCIIARANCNLMINITEDWSSEFRQEDGCYDWYCYSQPFIG